MNNETEKRPINIYQVINEFTETYGRKITKIKASFASDGCLFIRVDFGETKDQYKNWKQKTETEKHINQIMFRIWIDEDNETQLFVPWEKRKSRFVLFYDNIYTNEYLMPDYDEAKAFYDAREKYFGGKGIVKLGSRYVEIPDKMLKTVFDKMQKQMCDDAKHVTKKFKYAEISIPKYIEHEMQHIIESKQDAESGKDTISEAKLKAMNKIKEKKNDAMRSLFDLRSNIDTLSLIYREIYQREMKKADDM